MKEDKAVLSVTNTGPSSPRRRSIASSNPSNASTGAARTTTTGTASASPSSEPSRPPTTPSINARPPRAQPTLRQRHPFLAPRTAQPVSARSSSPADGQIIGIAGHITDLESNAREFQPVLIGRVTDAEFLGPSIDHTAEALAAQGP